MTERPEKSRENIIRTYDAIAPHFDVTRYKPWPETVRFTGMLAPGSLVLDLGCGNGRNSRFMAEKGMNVFGIDFSANLINLAKNRSDSEIPDGAHDFAIGDAEKIPVKDGELDAVLYIATLHHLTSPAARLASLREIRRCLKPGGLCLVSVWAREQEKFDSHLEVAPGQLGEDWEEGDILLPWHMRVCGNMEGDEAGGSGLGSQTDECYLRYYHLFSEAEFDDLLVTTQFRIEERFCSADNHYAVLKK